MTEQVEATPGVVVGGSDGIRTTPNLSFSRFIPHWRSHIYLTASARPNAGRSGRHGQSLCAYPLGIHRDVNSSESDLSG